MVLVYGMKKRCGVDSSQTDTSQSYKLQRAVGQVAAKIVNRFTKRRADDESISSRLTFSRSSIDILEHTETS